MIGAKQTAHMSTSGIPRHFTVSRSVDSGSEDATAYLQWIDKRGREIFPLNSTKIGASYKKANGCKENAGKSSQETDAVKDEMEVMLELKLKHRQEKELAERLDARDAREFFFALRDRGWAPVEGRDAFSKDYIFNSFDEAWSFMSQTVEEARVLNRYPDWTHAYNEVTVTLPGSLCHGVSLQDARLARFMETVQDLFTK